MRWTTEQIDTAKNLKATGQTSAVVAATLSRLYSRYISAQAVSGIIERNDLEGSRERAEGRKQAYFGRRALMIKMAGNGHTVAQIARALGESRASVVWAVSSATDDLGRSPALPETRWSSYWPQPPTTRELPDMPEPPITTAGKEFMDMGERECKWWIGDDPDGHMRFCCEPRLSLRPYCAAHYPQSILPPEDAA